MKVLITGFDPFGGEKINPAWEAVRALPDNIDGIEVVKLQIPTVFKKSAKKLFENIDSVKPDVVICVGQAGGRYEFSVERVAINVDDGRIPDNDGYQPVDSPVFEDGENAYFSTLPIKAIVEEVKKAGIPAAVSNTAGTFVCNHVTYGVRHLIETKYQGKRSGFIHIPFLPQQVVDKKNMPSMSLDTIVQALVLAIEAIVEIKEDIKVTGGATH